MKLTTKGRYAVTAMLDLALHYDKGSVTLADIARRQGISLSYLEQLFAKLRRSHLVESVRGPGGGYNLAKQPGEISVAQIILAINENIDATRCGGERNCQGDQPCLTHQLWEDLSGQIYQFLDGITLGDLVERPHVQQVASRQEAQGRVALPVREVS
jgi:Rrf2 family transcriptional regulator, iron-sulfur cluster assembly transcription factor